MAIKREKHETVSPTGEPPKAAAPKLTDAPREVAFVPGKGLQDGDAKPATAKAKEIDVLKDDGDDAPATPSWGNSGPAKKSAETEKPAVKTAEQHVADLITATLKQLEIPSNGVKVVETIDPFATAVQAVEVLPEGMLPMDRSNELKKKGGKPAAEPAAPELEKDYTITLPEGFPIPKLAALIEKLEPEKGAFKGAKPKSTMQKWTVSKDDMKKIVAMRFPEKKPEELDAALADPEQLQQAVRMRSEKKGRTFFEEALATVEGDNFVIAKIDTSDPQSTVERAFGKDTPIKIIKKAPDGNITLTIGKKLMDRVVAVARETALAGDPEGTAITSIGELDAAIGASQVDRSAEDALGKQIDALLGKNGTRVDVANDGRYMVTLPAEIPLAELPKMLHKNLALASDTVNEALKHRRQQWEVSPTLMRTVASKLKNEDQDLGELMRSPDTLLGLVASNMSGRLRGLEEATIGEGRDGSKKPVYVIHNVAYGTKPTDGYFHDTDIFALETGPDGKPVVKTEPVNGPDGKPIEGKTRQINVFKTEPLPGPDGKPVEGKTRRIPAVDAQGQTKFTTRFNTPVVIDIDKKTLEAAIASLSPEGREKKVQERFAPLASKKVSVGKSTDGTMYEVHMPAKTIEPKASIGKFLGLSEAQMANVTESAGTGNKHENWLVPESVLKTVIANPPEEFGELIAAFEEAAKGKAGFEKAGISRLPLQDGKEQQFEIAGITPGTAKSNLFPEVNAQDAINVTRAGGPIIISVPATDMEEACLKERPHVAKVAASGAANDVTPASTHAAQVESKPSIKPAGELKPGTWLKNVFSGAKIEQPEQNAERASMIVHLSKDAVTTALKTAGMDPEQCGIEKLNDTETSLTIPIKTVFKPAYEAAKTAAAGPSAVVAKG